MYGTEVVKLHSKNNLYAIFSVLLHDNYQVYMKCERYYASNDLRAIIIVDTLKFLELWKADTVVMQIKSDKV